MCKKSLQLHTSLPAKEPTFRPAVAPARVCKAPREAMVFIDELFELGDDPERMSWGRRIKKNIMSSTSENTVFKGYQILACDFYKVIFDHD